MTKRHKIPDHKLVKIPMYMTPCLPERGQFTRYTTASPLDIWNRPTLECVARHCLCQITKQSAQAEIARRDALAQYTAERESRA